MRRAAASSNVPAAGRPAPVSRHILGVSLASKRGSGIVALKPPAGVSATAPAACIIFLLDKAPFAIRPPFIEALFELPGPLRARAARSLLHWDADHLRNALRAASPSRPRPR